MGKWKFENRNWKSRAKARPLLDKEGSPALWEKTAGRTWPAREPRLKRDSSHLQADAFAGANAEEKSACSVRNDGARGRLQVGRSAGRRLRLKTEVEDGGVKPPLQRRARCIVPLQRKMIGG